MITFGPHFLTTLVKPRIRKPARAVQGEYFGRRSHRKCLRSKIKFINYSLVTSLNAILKCRLLK